MPEGEFDMDAAEAAYNQSRGGGAPDDDLDLTQPDDEPVAPDDEDETQSAADDGVPPGFLPYDEYIQNGGDPDRYVGAKAYQAQYESIQDNKALRSEVKGLKDTVQQAVEATQQVLTQSEERIRAEVEAELLVARENEDVDGAIAAQRKLDKFDEKIEQKSAPQQRGEHQEIATFRERTPLIDPKSEQFNPDFNTAVENAFNGYARQGLTQTDDQVKRALKASVDAAKGLYPELFNSPRNNRQQANVKGRQPRRQAQGEPAARAEDYKIDNPRNPRQGNAASEIRETIRATAIKNAKKRGVSEADQKKEGDTAAADFERSLVK